MRKNAVSNMKVSNVYQARLQLQTIENIYHKIYDMVIISQMHL